MNEFYVYLYRRNDTNDVFYIGKGKAYRAEMINGHNDHCKKIANKHGFHIEYYASNLPECRALQIEQELIDRFVNDYGYSIEIFGLRDRDNPHNLCNHTMGGEGFSGGKWDDEHKELFRQQTTARNAIYNPLLTKESIEKARKTRKEQAKRGELYTQTLEFREYQRQRMLGDNNPAKSIEARRKLSQHASTWQLGAKNNKAIGVQCLSNGMIFETQRALAEYAGIKRTADISEKFKKSKDGVIVLKVNGESLQFKRMPKISSKE